MFKFRFDTDTLKPISQYLFEIKQSSDISPKRLFIYPTGLCDDKCKYCVDGVNAKDTAFLQYNKEKDFFGNRLYIDKLISDIIKLKIIDLHIFGGGEPFFYKENLFYFLDKLKKVDIFTRVITNANSLNDADIKMIVAEKLLSQLNISFSTDSDAAAKNIYARAERHAHSLEVLNSITRYKHIYKTDFPKIHVMFVILNINYNKVVEIIELLKEHAIEFFMFQPLRIPLNARMEMALSQEQEQEFIKSIPDIEKMLKKHNMRSNIDSLKPLSSSPLNTQVTEGMFSEWVKGNNLAGNFYGAASCNSQLINKYCLKITCHMPLTTTAICYNGNIPFCAFKYNEQYRLNYFDTPSLLAFVQSQEHKGFVNYFINGTLPEICKDCSFCIPCENEAIKHNFANLLENAAQHIHKN